MTVAYSSELAPNGLMNHMNEAVTNLSRLVSEYHDMLIRAVKAEALYRELYAKTYLEVKASGDKMTVTEIDARVTERVKDAKFEADMADALVKAKREEMDVERKSIEVAQSALAWSRTELEHTVVT